MKHYTGHSALTKREAMVIAMRFGLAGHRDHTLEEIGKQFGVTRERIRQIEAKITHARHKITQNNSCQAPLYT